MISIYLLNKDRNHGSGKLEPTIDASSGNWSTLKPNQKKKNPMKGTKARIYSVVFH